MAATIPCHSIPAWSCCLLCDTDLVFERDNQRNVSALKATGCTLKEFPHLTSMFVPASVKETVSWGLDKILLSNVT